MTHPWTVAMAWAMVIPWVAATLCPRAGRIDTCFESASQVNLGLNLRSRPDQQTRNGGQGRLHPSRRDINHLETTSVVMR